VYAKLRESGARDEIRQPVAAFREGRDVLVAESEIQHEPRRYAPVILEEPCVGLRDQVSARVADENLPVAGGCPGHELLKRREGHAAKCPSIAEGDLSPAAKERADAGGFTVTELAAHLETVTAPQVGKVFDELEDVIRAVVLGEVGATAHIAVE